MPYGKFLSYYKSSIMIRAHELNELTNVVSFPKLEKREREKFLRSLRQAAETFLEKGIKDYREVFRNIAQSMMGKNG